MNLFWLFLKFSPIIISIGGPLTVVTTYSIALATGHIKAIMPYVSDTGTKPPESCIFGFFLSSSSFILSCIGYVRYLEVHSILALKPSIKIKPVWNTVAFASIIISSVGLNMVASFQELNEFTTHFTGAVLCFFCGAFYFICQTVFTRRIYPEAKALFYIRVILSVFCIAFLLGMFIPVHNALSEFKGDDILHWSEEDGGYMWHLISAYSEWALVISFISFLYTLFWDFRKFDMEPPTVKFKKLDLTQDYNAANETPKNAANETPKNAANENRRNPSIKV